jgi:Ser/Thr protein kinase RdoA (MazF antagonist)
MPFENALSQVIRAYDKLFSAGAVTLETLRASRPVCRFVFGKDGRALVGKFFINPWPSGPKDRGLLKEYQVYRKALALGLTGGVIPRLVGRLPEARLGLLLEAVPGYDLDHYLHNAVHHGGLTECFARLQRLAELLAFFHTRPLTRRAVTFAAALTYFQKLVGQLESQGLLSVSEKNFLEEESRAWSQIFGRYDDHQVLLHGDATPTNFLFPDGRAVALDLERLRAGDRLFDLSWVAGELCHAWGFRGLDFRASEPAIRLFFRAYLEALPKGPPAAERIFALNPFYMALAELRIARNDYLSWDYRRALLKEACQCLTYGRMSL